MGAVTTERPAEALRARLPQTESVLAYAVESMIALDDLDDLRDAIRSARRELRAVEALLDGEAM